MTIQITGNGEKRAVVYPLLHILNHFGGGLLISDDGMYRRMFTDKDGFIGNVKLIAGSMTSFDTLKSIHTHGYDIVIRDTEDVLDNADFIIRVCRSRNDNSGRAVMEICADFERPKGKMRFIPLSLSLLRELRNIEVSGRLGAFRNAAAVKVLCPVFADILGVSPAAIKNLLRKGGALT